MPLKPMPLVNSNALFQDNLFRNKLFQGDQCWLGHVVDISFKGVLIKSHSPFIFDNKTVIITEIFFENGTGKKIKVEEAHNNGQLYGFLF